MANDHAQPLFHPGLEKSFTEAAAGTRALDERRQDKTKGLRLEPLQHPYQSLESCCLSLQEIPRLRQCAH